MIRSLKARALAFLSGVLLCAYSNAFAVDPNPYDLLGVRETSSDSEIRAAYDKKVAAIRSPIEKRHNLLDNLLQSNGDVRVNFTQLQSAISQELARDSEFVRLRAAYEKIQTKEARLKFASPNAVPPANRETELFTSYFPNGVTKEADVTGIFERTLKFVPADLVSLLTWDPNEVPLSQRPSRIEIARFDAIRPKIESAITVAWKGNAGSPEASSFVAVLSAHIDAQTEFTEIRRATQMAIRLTLPAIALQKAVLKKYATFPRAAEAILLWMQSESSLTRLTEFAREIASMSVSGSLNSGNAFSLVRMFEENPVGSSAEVIRALEPMRNLPNFWEVKDLLDEMSIKNPSGSASAIASLLATAENRRDEGIYSSLSKLLEFFIQNPSAFPEMQRRTRTVLNTELSDVGSDSRWKKAIANLAVLIGEKNEDWKNEAIVAQRALRRLRFQTFSEASLDRLVSIINDEKETKWRAIALQEFAKRLNHLIENPHYIDGFDIFRIAVDFSRMNRPSAKIAHYLEVATLFVETSSMRKDHIYPVINGVYERNPGLKEQVNRLQSKLKNSFCGGMVGADE